MFLPQHSGDCDKAILNCPGELPNFIQPSVKGQGFPYSVFHVCFTFVSQPISASIPHVMTPHAVDATCAELRRLASERRQDWKRALSLNSLNAANETLADWANEKRKQRNERNELIVREEWRCWREGMLLAEIAELPDGHRLLLQALLCDTLAGYEEQANFSTPVPPREQDSFSTRLTQLAQAAHAETLRLIPPASREDYPSRNKNLSGLLQQKLRALRNPLGSVEQSPQGDSAISVWDTWYAKAEQCFRNEAPRQARLLDLRQRAAARRICRALLKRRAKTLKSAAEAREDAAVVIQLACRRRFLPRLRHLRSTLDKARRACLMLRLTRRLRRYILRRRSSGWSSSLDVDQAAKDAVVRIQAFCRARWSKGWSYCWAPPFKRANTFAGRSKNEAEGDELPSLTLEMVKVFAKLRQRRKTSRATEFLRRAWIPILQPEVLLLHSWCSEVAEQERRQEFEARSLKRFELQWRKYAEGLEAFARSQALEGRRRDHWVATADRDGKAVWMNERTGQIRNNDPTESRVRGTMAREKKKAETQLEEHLAAMRSSWEQEDEATACMVAAGCEELQVISRSAFIQAAAAVQKHAP